MENMLVWRCKGEEREKIPVAWFSVLKPLFSVQDEQLIKTAIKISVWNQPKVQYKTYQAQGILFWTKRWIWI